MAETLFPPARVCFRVPGQPVAKGRPIAGRGFNGHTTLRTPEKTVNYESRVALAAEQAMGGRRPLDGPLYVEIDIVIQIPASWSKKKREMAVAGRIGATKKPDASNILKAVEDGMNGVVFVDDSQIVDGRQRKRYGETPGVSVEVVELPLEKA